jgi:ABC-type multidrug transport system ATPase subunit
MNYLHVDSVIKSFGTRQVLTDVFLSCRQGEIVGLLGRNGTGKSTLMKIIFGALQAENKFIKINNEFLAGSKSPQRDIKYLPQSNFIPAQLTIASAISLLCALENIEELQSHPLVAPILDKPMYGLSAGEQRVVEIISIVFSRGMFALLDEPFNGVAPIYKEEIQKTIKEQSNRKGFIITDHDYRNVLSIATRLVLLHDGGIKAIRSSDELELWGYLPEE